MKKGLFLFFSLFLFFVIFFFHKKNNKNIQKIINYEKYDEKKHFCGVDTLINRYKFWLFHEDFVDGQCPTHENFNSGWRYDDFNPTIKNDYNVLVGLNGRGDVIAFISYYISSIFDKHTTKNEKIGRVHLLCVDEPYRREGIARTLVERVVDYFKEESCVRCYLTTRPENIRAKNLYYSCGFSEMTMQNTDRYDSNSADFLVKDLTV